MTDPYERFGTRRSQVWADVDWDQALAHAQASIDALPTLTPVQRQGVLDAWAAFAVALRDLGIAP
jgi:hypothetical protein